MSQRKVTGEKVTHIAQDMNINRTHLYSLEDKYAKDPTMQDKERPDRPLKVDERLERTIVRIIEKKSFSMCS